MSHLQILEIVPDIPQPGTIQTGILKCNAAQTFQMPVGIPDILKDTLSWNSGSVQEPLS